MLIALIMEHNLLTTSEHAFALATFLDQTEDPSMWMDVKEWLRVASGIGTVTLDTRQFDVYIGWCRFADEFMEARDRLLQDYVTELTRFTYCWAALECAVDAIAPPPAPLRGKINNACCYIAENSHSTKGVRYYTELLYDFRQRLVECQELRVLRRFESPSFVSINSQALYVIYGVRNQFAHAELALPLPDSDNQPQSPYIPLVQLASRLTLMSIQHLVGAAHKEYEHTWEAILDDGEEVEHEFHAFLNTLHVKRGSQNRRLL